MSLGYTMHGVIHNCHVVVPCPAIAALASQICGEGCQVLMRVISIGLTSVLLSSFHHHSIDISNINNNNNNILIIIISNISFISSQHLAKHNINTTT
jgi:hypothetical protein